MHFFLVPLFGAVPFFVLLTAAFTRESCFFAAFVAAFTGTVLFLAVLAVPFTGTAFFCTVFVRSIAGAATFASRSRPHGGPIKTPPQLSHWSFVPQRVVCAPVCLSVITQAPRTLSFAAKARVADFLAMMPSKTNFWLSRRSYVCAIAWVMVLLARLVRAVGVSDEHPEIARDEPIDAALNFGSEPARRSIRR